MATCINERATIRKMTRWIRTYGVSREGIEWYEREGHETVKAMVMEDPSLSEDVCRKVIAIASANTSWEGNKTIAKRWARGEYADSGGRFAHMAVLRRDPSSMKGLGQKTGVFYRALSGDTSAVTVDLWMMRAASILPGMVRREQPAKSDVEVMTRVITKVARRTGLTPREVQASVWVIVRGRP